MSIGLSKVSELKTLTIIVNYRSRDLTLDAVDSVLKSVSIGPVEIVVVDNSEDKDEAAILRSHLPAEVKLLVSPENLGFGRACNLAFEQFQGELILLINPDAKLLPGCLVRLQRTLLSSNNIAAVSPQIFWDDDLKFYLPPSIPVFYLDFQAFFDSWRPQATINRFLSAIWRYHSIKVWQSRKPVTVNNLSGGLVFLKGEAVRKAGGLFDPRFFLYCEDTDLFLRLRKAGYTLLIEPRARAVHYYDQCGSREWEWKRSLMAGSKEIFLEKYKGRKHNFSKALCHFRLPIHRDIEGPGPPDFASPFTLKIPGHLQGRWLFEWSPNPSFIPAVGNFGEGPCVDFSETHWSMLSPGQYFGRLGSPVKFGKYPQMVTWMVS